MRYSALQNYLSSLHTSDASHPANNHLWQDEQGRACGRYFKASLTSAFQTIRTGDDNQVIAYEAYARTYAPDDHGLNIWKLLEYAASDDESVELDRLCRLLHTINFYRQAPVDNLDLYLSVHSRLLAAVAGNHGMAFRRILDALELPHQKIVLQLPLITPSQRWVLTHVAENYKRNGFRIGANAGNLEQAIDLLELIRPDAIKIDISQANDAGTQMRLLQLAERNRCKIIFKRIESEEKLQTLQKMNVTNIPFYVQGFLFDAAKASVDESQLNEQLHAQFNMQMSS